MKILLMLVMATVTAAGQEKTVTVDCKSFGQPIAILECEHSARIYALEQQVKELQRQIKEIQSLDIKSIDMRNVIHVDADHPLCKDDEEQQGIVFTTVPPQYGWTCVKKPLATQPLPSQPHRKP